MTDELPDRPLHELLAEPPWQFATDLGIDITPFEIRIRARPSMGDLPVRASREPLTTLAVWLGPVAASIAFAAAAVVTSATWVPAALVVFCCTTMAVALAWTVHGVPELAIRLTPTQLHVGRRTLQLSKVRSVEFRTESRFRDETGTYETHRLLCVTSDDDEYRWALVASDAEMSWLAAVIGAAARSGGETLPVPDALQALRESS